MRICGSFEEVNLSIFLSSILNNFKKKLVLFVSQSVNWVRLSRFSRRIPPEKYAGNGTNCKRNNNGRHGNANWPTRKLFDGKGGSQSYKNAQNATCNTY